MKETKTNVPIWEKYSLTINEAAEYFNISTTKLRAILENIDDDFIIKNGVKTLIKRKMFEKFLDKTYSL